LNVFLLFSLQTLEGKRREEEEENLRKNDQKKIKKLKDKDLPMAIEKINKANTTIVIIIFPKLHKKPIFPDLQNEASPSHPTNG